MAEKANASGARIKPRGSSATMSHRDPNADDTDFFPTPCWGARVGGELIKRIDPLARSAWEPACGAGHMVHGLKDYFDFVGASDKYVYDRNPVFDFVAGADGEEPYTCDWIVTNPPFAPLSTFIQRAHRRARRGCAMLVRLAALEGVGRYRLLYHTCPLTFSVPFAERLPMVKGRYDPDQSSAAAYAWFIFLKRPAVLTSPYRDAIEASQAHRMHLQMGVKPGAKSRLTRPSDRAFAVSDAKWVEAA